MNPVRRPIDVSMPLFEGMPAFPGDPPFASERLLTIGRGDAYNLSRLSLGSHAGTHVDPPGHFLPGAPGTDALDLEVLNGPCQVVHLPGAERVVSAGRLPPLPPGTRRVLFRTANSDRWARRLEYFDDYVALGLDAARQLVDRGVQLVGVDALSAEVDEAGRFPVHRELLGRGVVIVEGLLLHGVAPGTYELHCLPLAVRGGDGGPARVILVPR